MNTAIKVGQIICLSLLFVVCGYGQLTDVKKYSEALKLAREQDKPLMLYFTADWCGPCKRLKKEVFAQPEFYNYVNDNFIFKSVNFDRSRSLVDSYNVRGIPNIIIEKDNTIIKSFRGYNPNVDYLESLKSLTIPKTLSNDEISKIGASGDEALFISTWNDLLNNNYEDAARTLAEEFIEHSNDHNSYVVLDLLTFYNGDEAFKYQDAFIENAQSILDSLDHMYITDMLTFYHADEWLAESAKIDRVKEKMARTFGNGPENDLYNIYLALFFDYGHDETKAAVFVGAMTGFLKDYWSYGQYREVVLNRLANFVLASEDSIALKHIYDVVYTVVINNTENVEFYDILAIIKFKLGEKEASYKLIAEATSVAYDFGLRYKSMLPVYKNLGLLKVKE